MIIAPNILMILVATALRSAGSAGLWIYSTLMLQLQVPNQLLGRILALEMALFTVILACPAVTSAAAWLQLGVHSSQLHGTAAAGDESGASDRPAHGDCHHCRLFALLSKAVLLGAAQVPSGLLCGAPAGCALLAAGLGLGGLGRLQSATAVALGRALVTAFSQMPTVAMRPTCHKQI